MGAVRLKQPKFFEHGMRREGLENLIMTGIMEETESEIHG